MAYEAVNGDLYTSSSYDFARPYKFVELNMNLHVGDSIGYAHYEYRDPTLGLQYRLIEYPYLKVVAEDRIKVHGIVRKRLKIAQMENPDKWDYWVEGIGVRDMYTAATPHIYSPSRIHKFVACYEDGKLIFEAADFDAPSYTGE